MCDQFLKESSYYFTELNQIIIEGLKKKTNNKQTKKNKFTKFTN
jgi:hypothetical protein